MERNASREWVPNGAGRFGRADAIAGAVAYLVSSFADFIGETGRATALTLRRAATATRT